MEDNLNYFKCKTLTFFIDGRAGGTIPPEILVPNLHPDVVISDRNI